MEIGIKDDVRLHRTITGTTSVTVWEYLSSGKSLAPLVENVPDEFYDWVTKVGEDLINKYYSLIYYHKKVVLDVKESNLVDRKRIAVYFKSRADDDKTLIISALFAFYDDKIEQAKSLIWKSIKPARENYHSKEK